MVLGHVPAGLQGPVPGGVLGEAQPQTRVGKNVHQQLGLAVREQTLAAQVPTTPRVDVGNVHPGGEKRRDGGQPTLKTFKRVEEESSDLKLIYFTNTENYKVMLIK